MTEDEMVGWHHQLNGHEFEPTHVARLEFPRETGLILRFAGKAGKPFQTTQWNRLSCRDQEGRRGSSSSSLLSCVTLWLLSILSELPISGEIRLSSLLVIPIIFF